MLHENSDEDDVEEEKLDDKSILINLSADVVRFGNGSWSDCNVSNGSKYNVNGNNNVDVDVVTAAAASVLVFLADDDDDDDDDDFGLFIDCLYFCGC